MGFGIMRKARTALAAFVIGGVAMTASPASAQFFLNAPPYPKGVIDGSDPQVGLPIPGASPAEYRAHLIWNTRAGMNVAALQCQFAPFLRTVDNYNGILAHHGKELNEAYSTMVGYFKRTAGAAKGQKAFDDYTTMTYNNFSTFFGQYGFCQTAADIMKEALAQPKGNFYATASGRMRELRASVSPYGERLLSFNPAYISEAARLYDVKCYDKKGNVKKSCLRSAGR